MRKWMYGCVLILGVISWAEADRQVCNSKIVCADCITAHSECAWCKEKEFGETRCDHESELQAKKCGDIIYPKNNVTALKNDELRDGSETQNPIQLQPQKSNLRLRPGKESTINMKYRIARNLPIDMYFVLDFTTTMSNRIQTLADITEALITTLTETFTTNIHIGFGSFLDKPVQPFHISTPQHLANPCLLQNTTCGPSYGYIHRRKLDNKINEFVEAIRKSNTSSNFDPMEGGLDAIMQAAVCPPDIIGWRTQSRRVLVYMSDGGFHFAGDGKLAGIDTPHDAKCHMANVVKNGVAMADEYMYTHSTTLDYPSYGVLSKALDDNRINTFFLVERADKALYDGLSGVLKQASTAILEASETSDIVRQIKEYYTSLSEKIEISGSDIPEELEVKIATDCSNGGVVNTRDLKKENAKCKSLTIGKTVNFDVIITLLECPKDVTKRNHTFKILPAGLQEWLEITVDYTCDCNCPQSEELNKICSNGNGTYQCGVCVCNPGRSGELCQCDKDSNPNINEDNCKRDNTTSVVCENQGTCKCGQCNCLPNYDGRYCQCDTSLCIMKSLDSDQKCSGREQGDCVCDACKCKNGFYGEYCQCPPRANCLGSNGLICSGNGVCDCGVCICDVNYEGETCSECPNCNRCSRCGHKDCVECLETHSVSGINSTNLECVRECSMVNISRVDQFKEDEEPCGFIDAEKCEISYRIKCYPDNDNVTLQIAKGKLCTHPPNPLLIALPVLGGILGVGLLILVIWKILTLFYDKIEYAKFEHEIQNAKWSKTDNPIYRTPVTSNQNPVYKGTID